MNYLTLYRQWRPQTFGEVVGQKNTVTGLQNAVRDGKLAHAYLFYGPRGSGKTSLAKIFAKAVNCMSPVDGEPCNKCPSCTDINNGSFMDVLEIDAASNRGIDEIRDLREKVRVLPAQGKKKVYIIDEVHMLTTEAFNALLKTLEEPPESVVFILATTEANRVPGTVLSRCQRYAFTRLSTAEVVGRLEEVAGSQGVRISGDALQVMARRANGSLRDALSIMEQCLSFRENDIGVSEVLDVLGLVNQETLAEIFRAMLGQETSQVLGLINDLLKQGKEPIQIARDASLCARDLLQLRLLGAQAEMMVMTPDSLQQIMGGYASIPPMRLSQTIKHLLKLADELRYNEGQRFLLEVGFIEAMELLGESTPQTVAPVKKDRPAARKPTPAAEAPPAQSAPPSAADGGPSPWDSVLEKVKANKVTTHALLAPATVIGIDDKVLSLGYGPEKKFHREKMEEKGNQEILQQVLREVFGHSLEIRLVALEEVAEQSEVVRKALEVFGKDRVKIAE